MRCASKAFSSYGACMPMAARAMSSSSTLFYIFPEEQPISTTGLLVRVANLERGREIDTNRQAARAPRV